MEQFVQLQDTSLIEQPKQLKIKSYLPIKWYFGFSKDIN